jgi:hypothetical protein
MESGEQAGRSEGERRRSSRRRGKGERETMKLAAEEGRERDEEAASLPARRGQLDGNAIGMWAVSIPWICQLFGPNDN